jgi:uncharacterized phage infection (PIP) family protein YhgE
MAKEQPSTLEDIIQTMIGSVMPLARKQIADLVKKILPKEIKKPWIASIIGGIAQIVERRAKLPLNLQESFSNLIEAFAREIAAQSEDTPKEAKEKIGAKRIEEIFAKQLEEATRKIAEAENIENEKERQKAIIAAETEIIKAYLEAISGLTKSTQEQVEVKEGKKIDWEKVFNEIKKALNKTWEKVKEETPKGYQKTKEAVKTMDQKAEKLADKLEELRKKIRRHGLIARREREE